MIEPLVRAWLRVGGPPDHRSLADALWLARHLPSAAAEEAEAPPAPDAPESQAAAPPPAPPPPLTQAPEPKRRTEVVREEAPAEERDVYPRARTAPASHAPAAEVDLPAAAGLPHALEIARALRPLSRRIPSRQARELDEEATVHRSAEGGGVVPVFRPVPERWFEVALVVEDAPAMVVWRQTIAELYGLLQRQGAFRDVRRWTLCTDGGAPRLHDASGAVRTARELRHPQSRRLVLVVSDCVSPAWRDGSVAELLAGWAGSTPVAVVQVLPPSLWRHTGLGPADLRLRALLPGAPNDRLDVRGPAWDPRPTGGVPLPAVTLDPASLGGWARMLMAMGVSAPGVLLAEAEEREEDEGAAVAGPVPAAERVQRFRALASPAAYDLATYLSVVPLSLPVMRLLHQAMVPDARQVQLAEVLLGGLIERVTPAGEECPPDEVEYDFFEGVRDVLLGSLRRSELFRIVSDPVARLIERRTGVEVDFRALVEAADGERAIPEAALPFARLARRALERLGIPPKARAVGSEMGGPIRPGASEVARPAVVEEEVYVPGLTIRMTVQLPAPVTRYAWSPNGRMLAVLDEGGCTTIRADTGQVVPELTKRTGPGDFPPIVYVSKAQSLNEIFGPPLLQTLERAIKELYGSSVQVVAETPVAADQQDISGSARAAIANASLFVALIDEAYLESRRCRNEFARYMERTRKTPPVAVTLLEDPSAAAVLPYWAEEKVAITQWSILGAPLAPKVVSEDWRIRIWQLAVRVVELLSHDSIPRGDQNLPVALAWSPDSGMLAVAFKRGGNTFQVRVSGLGGVVDNSFSSLNPQVGNVADLAWAETIYASVHHGEIFAFHPNTGRWVGVLDSVRLRIDAGSWIESKARLPALSVSHEQTLLAGVGPGGGEVFRISAKQTGTRFGWSKFEIYGRPLLAWIPGTHLLATTQYLEDVAIWRLDWRERRVHFEISLSGDAALVSLSASPDGELLATTADDGAVCLYGTEDWTILSRATRRISSVSLPRLSFAPMGTGIVAIEGGNAHLLHLRRWALPPSSENRMSGMMDWAVVVGVGSYAYLPEVLGAREAALKFHDWLTSKMGGGVPLSQVQLMLSDPSGSQADQVHPSMLDIERALLDLMHMAASRDPKARADRYRRAYLYFAGYGFRFASGAEDVVLMAADASETVTRMINVQHYAELLIQSGHFREIVLLVDCTLIPRSTSPTFRVYPSPRASIKESLRTFYMVAGDVDGEKTGRSRRVGALTQRALEGLSGHAADEEGRVTTTALAEYLRSGDPRSTLHSQGSFVLTTVPRVRVVITPAAIFRGEHLTIHNLRHGGEVVSGLPGSRTPWEGQLVPGLYTVEVAGGVATKIFLVEAEPIDVHLTWRRRNLRVKVAGTGMDPLPDIEAWTCRALGDYLAMAGFGMSTAGWSGVDRAVTEAAVERLRSSGLSEDEWPSLRQVLLPGREPAVDAGEIVRVEMDLPVWPDGHAVVAESDEALAPDPLDDADALVLVAGLGVAYRVFQVARKRIPVFPVLATGGDAARAFEELQAEFGSSPAGKYLDSLAAPVATEEDARRLVARLVRMLPTPQDELDDTSGPLHDKE